MVTTKTVSLGKTGIVRKITQLFVLPNALKEPRSSGQKNRKRNLKINDCFYIKIYTSNSHYEKCLNLFVEIILLTAYKHIQTTETDPKCFRSRYTLQVSKENPVSKYI